MHKNQVKPEAKAHQYIAICRRGFDNEHAHRAWLRARIPELQTWPESLRAPVIAAWINSGPKEASNASAEGPQK